MGPLDLLWHLLNLFAMPVLLGLSAALGAKLLWRQAFASVRWHRLIVGASAAASASGVVGLVAFGRDGRMATYGLMVAATALALGWAGLRGR